MVPTIRKETSTGNAPLKAVTNRFPQVGGNRISEAQGVVFNPTPGVEGMETPPPNDSSKASLYPPVVCLKSLPLSTSVLNIITNGYVLIHSGYKALHKEQALTSCIQSLLSNNAIKSVENVKSLRFYSHLFLVPKPHQRWRPVERFKMETPESIRASPIPGEWVSSIDLSDTYLHIPIHPDSRKYPSFCHKSQVFQFTSFDSDWPQPHRFLQCL